MISILLIIISSIIGVVCNEEFCLGQICFPKNYNKYEPPSFDQEHVLVEMLLHKIKIFKVDDFENAIHVSLEVDLRWQDQRLNIEENITTDVVLGDIFLEKLWLPDLYLFNLNSNRKLSFVKNYEGLWLGQNSTIFYLFASEATFYCQMDFGSYPLDEHVCYMKFSSYTNDCNAMKINLEQFNFNTTEHFSLIDYTPTVKELPESMRTHYFEEDWCESVAGLEITLKRNIKQYIINFYLPSGLLAFLSWVR